MQYVQYSRLRNYGNEVRSPSISILTTRIRWAWLRFSFMELLRSTPYFGRCTSPLLSVQAASTKAKPILSTLHINLGTRISCITVPVCLEIEGIPYRTTIYGYNHLTRVESKAGQQNQWLCAATRTLSSNPYLYCVFGELVAITSLILNWGVEAWGQQEIETDEQIHNKNNR